MEIIANWQTKELECEKCKIIESVKWKEQDKCYCSKCVVNEVILTDEEKVCYMDELFGWNK